MLDRVGAVQEEAARPRRRVVADVLDDETARRRADQVGVPVGAKRGVKHRAHTGALVYLLDSGLVPPATTMFPSRSRVPPGYQRLKFICDITENVFDSPS